MEFLKKIKANYTVSALVCVILGLVLLIWPGTTTQIVCMVLGAALFLYGLAQVLVYAFTKEKTILSQGMLILGIVFLVIGAWILLKPDMIVKAVPMIVGALIVIHGLHNAAQAVDLKKSGYEKWWLALIFALLTVILGIVLICMPFTVVDTVVRLIGIFLIYDGVSDVWILSRVFKVRKQKERIIDVESVDVVE